MFQPRDCGNINTIATDNLIRVMIVVIPALSGLAVSLPNNTCAMLFLNDNINDDYEASLHTIVYLKCPGPFKDGSIGSFLFVVALFGLTAGAPSKRAGPITEPVAGTSITTGTSIPFNYNDLNECHEGYTPITVWLSDSVPTGLDGNGNLPAGTFIEEFGSFLIGNFGGLPHFLALPPTSLVIPNISSYSSGSALYLTVVETNQAGTCPPGGQPASYEFFSVQLAVA
ncbi:hypothetical protein C8F04DRAFT_1253920 [Mycena alexandri]|uniref:Uncharacterized protein n=1 Tax=Mycena alexandri TaxID=1745969 RepID=A0AAD6T832_9AGAR|nr:hypothetical protein C8F04DRAFT_1253920 [Mycena alexandri]